MLTHSLSLSVSHAISRDVKRLLGSGFTAKLPGAGAQSRWWKGVCLRRRGPHSLKFFVIMDLYVDVRLFAKI